MYTSADLQTLPLKDGKLGRFEVKKLLGRGPNASVWMAHDPNLQSHVALKLFNPQSEGNEPTHTQQWLANARNASPLKHSGIVPVLEAQVLAGRPALVLELVDGPTLAQRLNQVGALPAEQAVYIALKVLDALQHAHEHGEVHRHLKPTNILLDSFGNAKVTGFSVGTPIQAGTTSLSYASPGAALGESAHPQDDVFSMGLVLAEMLIGRPLLADADVDPHRTKHRLAQEDLQLPRDNSHPVDDALQAVVHRALARNPAVRFASAQEMAEGLRGWTAAFTDNKEGTAADGEGNATLKFLLRRMRHSSDFPAMSAQILKVQSLASSENESLNSLTSEILKDVALTHKLLRIVNSANFSHVGGGSISTVSRAVSLVGFAGIRNAAMSLVLLDHMENKVHADQLKGEFLRSMMAASLAAELAPQNTGDTEELFIGALFQNLGRMLTAFYFPKEAQQVREAMAGTDNVSEERAATTVLGISFEALGQGVGRAWGLPDVMLKLMCKPKVSPPGRMPTDPWERMHWQTMAANAMADVFLESAESDLKTQLQKAAAKYAACLGQGSDVLTKTALLVRDKLAVSADAIGLRVPAQSPAARLLRPGLPARAQGSKPGDHTLQANAESPSVPMVSVGPSVTEKAERASNLLATGIQDVTNAMMADEFRLNDVLRMILETMYRALGFRQVLFCLKDAQTESLVGRMGLGDGATEAARRFKVGLRESNNLFAVVCNKGVDTLIQDAHATKVSGSLPDWYRQHFNARSFLLLPLVLKGVPMGLIYADHLQADSIALDEKGLALLKTLRNQAVLAFKQTRS